MSECPYHNAPAKLRPELPPLPAYMRSLALDDRGYPVPFFVAWINGKPEFRAADAAKARACKLASLCWCCGKPLGPSYVFAIGPMCVLNRTTAEPPSHKECAEWSVRGCPFLSRPQMVRREKDEELEEVVRPAAGNSLDRNPGCTALWETDFYKTFSDGRGGELIQIGPMHSLTWWREGRPATRAEVAVLIGTGLPLLREQCDAEETAELRAEAHHELDVRLAHALTLLPTV